MLFSQVRKSKYCLCSESRIKASLVAQQIIILTEEVDICILWSVGN